MFEAAKFGHKHFAPSMAILAMMHAYQCEGLHEASWSHLFLPASVWGSKWIPISINEHQNISDIINMINHQQSTLSLRHKPFDTIQYIGCFYWPSIPSRWNQKILQWLLSPLSPTIPSWKCRKLWHWTSTSTDSKVDRLITKKTKIEITPRPVHAKSKRPKEKQIYLHCSKSGFVQLEFILDW